MTGLSLGRTIICERMINFWEILCHYIQDINLVTFQKSSQTSGTLSEPSQSFQGLSISNELVFFFNQVIFLILSSLHNDKDKCGFFSSCFQNKFSTELIWMGIYHVRIKDRGKKIRLWDFLTLAEVYKLYTTLRTQEW